jgi:nucleoid-associated protein YgaU
MVKTAGTKKTKVTPEETPKKGSSFFDYLRFGESYTSLILGIIVVVIATALLLAFVHNKNAGSKNIPIDEQTRNTAEVSQQVLELSNKAPSNINDSAVSIAPTDTIVPTSVPTVTPKPTEKPKPTVTPKPTAKPVHKVTPTPTVKPKITVKPTSKPTVVVKARPTVKPQVVKKIAVALPKKAKVSKESTTNKNVWVVKSGESLWIIAQKTYSNGYKWTDIARTNNLSNPSDIHVNDKLILPNIQTKEIAKAATVKNNSSIKHRQIAPQNSMGKITGNSYTVVKGDNLWNVALRAYGDGFRWGDIAKANNLANPRLIFSGNVLTIPR